MTIYSQVRRQEIDRGLDRETWADLTAVVFTQEVIGSGATTTAPLYYGLTYEGPPTFTYGVELAEGELLVDRDYPFVSAGVAAHIRKEDDEDYAEKQLLLPHIGATIWISVKSDTSYRLLFRLWFEGVAYKNPQYFGNE